MGVPVQDIWLDFKDAHNQNVRITGYPTEKNPDLLALIVRASSHAGDIVLDCFSGSGTTLDAASQLVHLQETFSDVVKTDKTGLSKTAHTRWMISALANFLPGSTIFRLA